MRFVFGENDSPTNQFPFKEEVGGLKSGPDGSKATRAAAINVYSLRSKCPAADQRVPATAATSAASRESPLWVESSHCQTPQCIGG
jgi:hypothetical protein